MMSRFLFERWWWLAAVLVLLELMLFALWTRTRRRGAGQAAWIGLAATVLLPIASHYVVTPREHVERLCRELARLIDTGQIDAIGRHLAPGFEVAGLDRDAFLDKIAATLTRYRVDGPALSHMVVTFPRDGEAEAVFDAVCDVRGPNGLVSRLLSRWRVLLVSTPTGRRVKTFKALPRPMSPIRSVRDILR